LEKNFKKSYVKKIVKGELNMERNNVSKNKMLNELAGNFVQAQEKENPITYSNLTDLELKMKESCIAKIIDEKGEEKYQSDNKSLSKIFEMKMADNPNFNEEYEKYSKADVSLLVLDKEDRKKLAEEINSILEDNKDIIESTKTKDKESNEINDFKKSLIINKVEEYYDKIEPIKLNDDLKDKTKEFSKSIDNVFAIAELYSFKNDKGEDVSTVFKGTIVQKDGEKEFSIKFSSLNDEKTIKSDSLLGLKDKVVNLIEEDKPKYRMSSFEDFKNEKIKEPDIEIENNFKFDFERTMNLSKGIIPKLYTLKIEDENVCKKVEFEDTFYKGFDKLAFTLVDKNTFKAFEKINEFENNIKTTYKDEYLKEENQRIVEKLDEFVKNEKLKEIEDGIFGKVAYERVENFIDYDLKDDFSIVDMTNFLAESFDDTFKVRINNLKDKEKAPSVSPDIDFEKMDAKDKDFHTNVRALGITRRMFTSDLKSETMDIQREIEKNIGLILTANNNLNENEKFRLYDEEKKDFNDSANQKIIDKFYKEFSEDYLKNTESFYKAPTREDFVESFSTTKHIFGFELGKNEIKIPNDKENMKEVEKTDKDKFDKEKDF
jgi:hypothetical protein